MEISLFVRGESAPRRQGYRVRNFSPLPVKDIEREFTALNAIALGSNWSELKTCTSAARPDVVEVDEDVFVVPAVGDEPALEGKCRDIVPAGMGQEKSRHGKKPLFETGRA